MQQSGTPVTCPNCRQPFTAQLEQIIDVQRDPQGKARLLAGRTNLVKCPHCGYQFMLATPLVYHDGVKELLLVYIPMELGLPQREQDRLIGSLSNAIMNSLPQEQRKGYLLRPRTMLTLQGLVETVLEADGITKDVIEGQRAKMRLVETFLQTDPDSLPDLIQQHDADIDPEFFTMLSATAEAALGSGRRDVAEQALALRDMLLEQTTAGQQLLQQAGQQEAMIQEVAAALNALGEQASYDDLVDLALQLASDENGDEKLQVLVGVARPTLDYQFFQTLTSHIDSAEGEEKEALEEVRERLLELTSMVDQQNEAVIKQATDLLREILGSPDIDSAINARLDLLDDTFLAVLSANVQAAEQAKDIATSAKLRSIMEKVVASLRENAPPAIKYINELMQYPSFEEAQASLAEHADEFGPELVQWMDMLGQDLATRGNSPALERLGKLRDEAVKALAVAGMNDEGEE